MRVEIDHLEIYQGNWSKRQSKRDRLKLILPLDKNRCEGDCAHAQGCAPEEQHQRPQTVEEMDFIKIVGKNY